MIGAKNRRATLRIFVPVLLAAMSLGGFAMAEPAKWIVRPAESKISFSGTHAGSAFAGEFRSWTADIRFDPNDLAGSKAVVLVDLTSAFTGDQTYDKTLPTADWFDVGKFAEGRFETIGFTAKGGNQFEAQGTLALRGVKADVLLKFTFDEKGTTAKLSGETTLQRLDFGIGKGSDAPGDWVSLDIPVSVSVVMDRAP
jgi:polyisoprenoid-binding protein YceI